MKFLRDAHLNSQVGYKHDINSIHDEQRKQKLEMQAKVNRLDVIGFTGT